MKFIRYTAFLLVVSLLGLLLSCATRSGYRLPVAHPQIFELGEKREFCTKCHGYNKKPIDFERYNHTALFTESHRLVAYQDEGVCSICHAQSFCNNCHATRIELKPSLQDETGNYRRIQHRGDYLTRHRIEGRIDPSSCFRCHGSPKSSKTCQSCHG